jgi:hypothetical protein
MMRIELRIKGHIDRDWSDWFEGFEIAHTEGDETILSGNVADQSALYGVMAKLRDLGVELVSLNQESMTD